jgi:hypothetical protein
MRGDTMVRVFQDAVLEQRGAFFELTSVIRCQRLAVNVRHVDSHASRCSVPPFVKRVKLTSSVCGAASVSLRPSVYVPSGACLDHDWSRRVRRAHVAYDLLLCSEDARRTEDEVSRIH